MRYLAVVLVASITLATAASCSAQPSPAASAPAAPSSATPARPDPDPYRFLPKVPSFSVTSKDVTDGQPLPKAQWSGIFKAGGQDLSPQLSWTGFPSGTKSFVVTMYDPESPTGSGFWHWVIADIPATTTSLPTNVGAPGGPPLPAGALLLPGDAGLNRFIGAAPPAGTPPHHFTITVTALDVPKSGVTVAASGALLGFFIGGHTIARATLVAPTGPA
jgi:Raf kinase inhibitor-like YbhB/YbcL family protein